MYIYIYTHIYIYIPTNLSYKVCGLGGLGGLGGLVPLTEASISVRLTVT